MLRQMLEKKIVALKELEHRKLGRKVPILKYDLGKSLSKEMWCKMTDYIFFWLHI